MYLGFGCGIFSLAEQKFWAVQARPLSESGLTVLVLLEAPSALSGVALIVSGAQDADQLYEGRTLRITPSVLRLFLR